MTTDRNKKNVDVANLFDKIIGQCMTEISAMENRDIISLYFIDDILTSLCAFLFVVKG